MQNFMLGKNKGLYFNQFNYFFVKKKMVHNVKGMGVSFHYNSVCHTLQGNSIVTVGSNYRLFSTLPRYDFNIKSANYMPSKKLRSIFLLGKKAEIQRTNYVINDTFDSILGFNAAYTQRHYFHMVTSSPWPLVVSILSFALALMGVLYMHSVASFFFIFIFLVLLILVMLLWARDVIREGTYEGMHTRKVKANLRQGVVLFILTEVVFFFGFFWAFFHSALAPTVQIGCIWPPVGITALNAVQLPLLNTCLLLLSGVYITICHLYVVKGYIRSAFEFYFYTLLMGAVFTLIQGFEYNVAQFTIADSVYGSTFFLLTGFHGFHVIVGTILIVICLIRTLEGHFSINRHVGFEAAAWYWHFVDVVWLGLFFCIYVWGNV